MNELFIAVALLVGYDDTNLWMKRLGSEDYHVRQEATRQLLASGRFDLQRKLMKGTDPEIRWRAQQCYERNQEELLRSFQPYPQLRMWWLQYSGEDYYWDIGSVACLRLMNFVSYQWAPAWTSGKTFTEQEYRRGTELWLRDCLKHGYPVWLLRLYVWEMNRRERLLKKR